MPGPTCKSAGIFYAAPAPEPTSALRLLPTGVRFERPREPVRRAHLRVPLRPRRVQRLPRRCSADRLPRYQHPRRVPRPRDSRPRTRSCVRAGPGRFSPVLVSIRMDAETDRLGRRSRPVFATRSGSSPIPTRCSKPGRSFPSARRPLRGARADRPRVHGRAPTAPAAAARYSFFSTWCPSRRGKSQRCSRQARSLSTDRCSAHARRSTAASVRATVRPGPWAMPLGCPSVSLCRLSGS
jgi:hypothetical protein